MPNFTKRELEIVEALGKGKSLKSIAEKAGAKDETVHEQADALKGKLGAATVEELPARFVEVTGWSNPPSGYAASPE